MEIHNVKGAGGVNLHVREWGDPARPPVLLVHGWSQNHLCWRKQYESELQRDFRLVAFDLRGHGMSDAPLQPEQYTDGDRWADDVAAVIDRLALVRPTLVGWSYGGLVICDYLRKHGCSNVAGIDFVGAAVVLGSNVLGRLIGPGFFEHAPGACHSDLPTNIAAIRNFLRACTAKPLERSDFELMLAFNMVVPPMVRAFLIQREVDCGPLLGGIGVPVLVTHGEADTVVQPAMAEHILRHCPTAEASWFANAGHAPFLEDAARFNRELAGFVTKVHS